MGPMGRRPFMERAARYLGVLAALVCLSLGPAAADEEFYKGKTITFIVGTAVGGGYDTYSRLVAAHIGAHLGGRPTVVAQNMPRQSDPQPGMPWTPDQFWVCPRCGRHFWTTYPPPKPAPPAPTP